MLTSLLAIYSAFCFTGCNDKGDTGNENVKDNVRTKISNVEDDGNDDTCPDCEERRMPKVRFEFKDGRPASKDGGNDGIEPPCEWHHIRRPLSPNHPKPTPSENNGQNKDEN